MTARDDSSGSDARLHDPAGRRLLFVRGPWEVRSAPGSCALAPQWLLRGMWHLQFFAPALGLSVLAFQPRSSLGPFIVKPGQTAAVRFDEGSLDEYLVTEWGLPPCGHQMANLVHLMEDKAVGCLLRMRAGTIAAKGDDEQVSRQMA